MRIQVVKRRCDGRTDDVWNWKATLCWKETIAASVRASARPWSGCTRLLSHFTMYPKSRHLEHHLGDDRVRLPLSYPVQCRRTSGLQRPGDGLRHTQFVEQHNVVVVDLGVSCTGRSHVFHTHRKRQRSTANVGVLENNMLASCDDVMVVMVEVIATSLHTHTLMIDGAEAWCVC